MQKLKQLKLSLTISEAERDEIIDKLIRDNTRFLWPRREYLTDGGYFRFLLNRNLSIVIWVDQMFDING
jgi:hypothetical protein